MLKKGKSYEEILKIASTKRTMTVITNVRSRRNTTSITSGDNPVNSDID
jgi:hypothetical protein